jgi:hypothetical protein
MVSRGQVSVAHDIVMKLACVLEEKGHCFSMDDYSTLVPLFA